MASNLYENVPTSYPPSDRANWLRGQASLLYGELTRRVIVPLIGSIEDREITDCLTETGVSTSTEPLYQAWDAIYTVNKLFDRVGNRWTYVHEALPGEDTFHTYLGAEAVGRLSTNVPFGDAANAYTFARRHERILHEGLRTILSLPCNLLAAAVSTMPPELQRDITSLQDIARVMRTQWFRQVIATAASPMNGMWGPLSNGVYYDLESARFSVSLPDSSVLSFTYSVDDHGLPMFDFNPEFIRTITEQRVAHNAQVRSAPSNTRQYSAVGGTSSGCPVNHRKPVFNNMPDREATMHMTEEVLGPVEPWNDTPINICLDALAGYLERAVAIQESIPADKIMPIAGVPWRQVNAPAIPYPIT